MTPLSTYRGLIRRPCILEVVVACLNEPDLFKLPRGKTLYQQIPNQQHQIFSCRGAIGKLRILIEIVMVESHEYLLSHNSIQLAEIHTSPDPSLHLILHGHQHHIIMAVSIEIIALSKH